MKDADDDVLLVLGGAGHASDVVSILEACGARHRIVVTDDRTPPKNRFENRKAELWVGSLSDHLVSGRRFIVGVGYPKPRKALAEQAMAAGLNPAEPLVHPSSVQATGSSIGFGSVVGALSFLAALSAVSDHAYVGYGARIGHDTEIGAFASVMPGSFIGGDCTIGEGAMIGANSTIHQGVAIGPWAVVGAGAVVLGDVPSGTTVVGNPAREIEPGR